MIVLVNALQHGLHTAPPKPAVPSRPGLTGFLYDKTGVTGAWTLGVGLSAYLISKELYVFNAEVGVLSSSLSPPSLPHSLSPFSPSPMSSPCHQSRIPPPFPFHFHSHTQTVTAVVVGGVVIWLVKKVGKPVAEYLDDRSQVRAGISSYLQLYMEVFKFNRTACGIVSCCHLHGNHFPSPLHTRTREFWMV